MDYRIKEDMSIPMNVKMMSANKTGRSNELKNQKTHNEGAMRDIQCCSCLNRLRNGRN